MAFIPLTMIVGQIVVTCIMLRQLWKNDYQVSFKSSMLSTIIYAVLVVFLVIYAVSVSGTEKSHSSNIPGGLVPDLPTD